MTLRLYAGRKKWPLERVTVRLQHSRVHEKDCETCSGKGKASETALLDHIEREIELEGPLTDEQRDRLIEIAEKCPVHRTLEAEIEIVTALRG